MKFGMIGSDWGEHPDIAQMFREMRETGWDGCELRLSLDWMGTPERMKKLVEEAEFTIFCLGARPAPLDPDYRQLIMRRIEYAAAIDVSNLMIFSPPRPKERPPTQSEYCEFAETAEKLAEYASQFGIILSFHHHSNHLIERISEAEIVLRQTHRLQLCLDSYHATIFGDDFIAAYRTWRDRVHYVHVHDGNGIKLLDLGEGNIPLGALLTDLRTAQYDGWLVAHGGATDRSPREKSRVCREYLESLNL